MDVFIFETVDFYSIWYFYLKFITIQANRKSRRDDAEKSSELMQQKILTNLIRSQVLQAAAGDASGPIGPYYTKPKSKSDKDTLFELPPIPETSKRFDKQIVKFSWLNFYYE